MERPATEPSLDALVAGSAAQGRAAARQAALQSLPSQPGGSRAGLPDELSGRGRIINLVT
ncbi:hypothetical protein [Fundidesulfovibrio magnetotacticus]|uniref:hypothetical protein n=1 Tax=Fundidesulfovibrio magnetotacticus TaxID=2730080 RepID=UPI00156462CA|nr:hypothetical protein [Fundidesulfovibrio magnetotacticus]